MAMATSPIDFENPIDSLGLSVGSENILKETARGKGRNSPKPRTQSLKQCISTRASLETGPSRSGGERNPPVGQHLAASGRPGA